MMHLSVVISGGVSIEKEVEVRVGNALRMIGGISELVSKRKELSKKPN